MSEPSAVLESTISIEDLDQAPFGGDGICPFTGESVEIFGALVCRLKYFKTKDSCSDRDYLALFVECNTKKPETTMDWGKYDAKVRIEIQKEPRSACWDSYSGILCWENKEIGHPRFICIDSLLKPEEGFVVNNKIKIVAKITSIIPWKSSEDQCGILKGSVAPPSLLGTFFESEIGADVTLIAKDKGQIKAHSGILIAASAVFKAMFEAPMEEAKQREINLDDMATGDSIRTFLKCLYTGSLSHLNAVGLLVLRDVINAAEKYGLETLKVGAGIFLPGYICPKNAIQMFHFSRRYGLEKAEKVVRDYIKANVDAVMENTVTPDWD